MRFALSVVFLATLPIASSAQRIELQGHVVGPRNAPIAHANVIVGRYGRFLANDSGTFVVRVSPGEATLELRRIGFQPVLARFTATADTVIVFEMVPVPQDLPAYMVVATTTDALANRGFYDRMRDADRGLITGYFVTPEDIEARRPIRTSQLVERVPGVRMLGAGGNNVIPVGMNDCAMTIYLDGARLMLNTQKASRGNEGMSIQRLRDQQSSRAAGQTVPEESFDAIIGVNAVTGIEIYPRGTRAPANFQLLNGTCGIIAVWTK
jgi:hypothetical protein